MSLEITVKNLDGPQFTLKVKPTDTVSSLKQKCKDELGVKHEEDCILVYDGRALKGEDQRNISEFEIKNGSVLYYAVRQGSMLTVFNNMNKLIIGKFAQTAPKWRIIYPGLNLEGICTNKKCQAYDKLVWMPKRFGRFNIAVDISGSLCPVCNATCSNVKSMALYLAKCVSKGKIKGKSQLEELRSEQREKDGFFKFEDKYESKMDWLSMEMEVTAI